MLQQGNFVGDVLYYYGDQAPNFVKPKHIDPSLGFGYDYDVTNSEDHSYPAQCKRRETYPAGWSEL